MTSLDNSIDNIFGQVSADDIFGGIDNDESSWKDLIDQIIAGNVIPVIGADLLIDSNNVGDRKNLHLQIIDYIARILKLSRPHNSFSDLVFDPDAEVYRNNPDQIYYHINNLLQKLTFPPSQMLRKILNIRQFPFVITTSFTPVVEKVMSQIWKDELRVLRFNNNPMENQDIKDETDLRKPTVYYMFGKGGENAHKYVLTDTDMLNFCSSWLSKDHACRPQVLSSKLRDKYLLMLGNNYSDWLFRFIWFSMRNTERKNDKKCMLAYEEIDEKLIRFLERTATFTKQNPEYVIDQITNRLERELAKHELTKFDKPENDTDIFISYSRSDSKVAHALYEELTKQGKRVWYDRKSLADGVNFMEEINHAIESAKYFIPILTNNVFIEKNEKHVYRLEWDKALSVAPSTGYSYMIPLSENGFDFYKASIPGKMQQYNAIVFNPTEDMSEVAARIIHKMNQD